MAAKKWDMAAAVASHLVKVEPKNAAGGSVSPIQLGPSSVSSNRKQFFLKACALHPAFQDCDRPTILIKTFGARHSTAMTATGQEASECSNPSSTVSKMRQLIISDLRYIWLRRGARRSGNFLEHGWQGDFRGAKGLGSIALELTAKLRPFDAL